MQFPGFAEDETTLFAVIRALEVAGEAVKRIPVEVREKYLRMNMQSTTDYYNDFRILSLDVYAFTLT